MRPRNQLLRIQGIAQGERVCADVAGDDGGFGAAMAGRSVFVTGAYGMLGGWLVGTLLDLGAAVTVLRRGEVIVDAARLTASAGSGRFLPRTGGAAAAPLGRLEAEMDPARNFGATLID